MLVAGRAGIFLPIRGEETYKEGAVGTVSVLDRRGRRLGTVYLGTMPKPGQGTLSAALTRLLREVLSRWEGPPPRLATQRFKALGMSWGVASGQVIPDLRLTRLSGVWDKVYRASLNSRPLVLSATQSVFYKSQPQIAA